MKAPLLHLAAQIFDTPLAIVPDKLDTILRSIGPRLMLDSTSIDELTSSGILRTNQSPNLLNLSNLDLNAYYDDEEDGPGSSDKGYKVTSAGIAIIPISGVLMKRGGWMSALSGCSSYQGIQRALDGAMSDLSVKGVLFDVNSPGGSTSGCFELSDSIHACRGKKPMFAVSNDLAASAAYSIASSADRVFVTRTGAVGSIGVFSLHCSQSALDEKVGLSYTYTHYGAKKTDGNEHEPLSKSAAADTQAEVDRQGDIFTSTVARNRSSKFSAIRDLQAGVLFADRSVPLLADAVGTYDDALTELTGKVNKRATISMTGSTSTPSTVAMTEGASDMEAAELQATLAAFKTDMLGSVKDLLAEDMKKKGKKAAPDVEPDEDDKDDEKDAKRASIAVAAAMAALSSDSSKSAKKSEADAKKSDPENEPDGDEDCSPSSKTKGSYACKHIVEACMLSGRPEAAADFIARDVKLSEVRKTLLDQRASKQAETILNPSFASTGVDSGTSLVAIAQQANSLQNSNSRLSPSQAMEQAIRSNPAAYRGFKQDQKRAVSLGMEEEYIAKMRPALAAFGLSQGGQ